MPYCTAPRLSVLKCQCLCLFQHRWVPYCLCPISSSFHQHTCHCYSLIDGDAILENTRTRWILLCLFRYYSILTQIISFKTRLWHYQIACNFYTEFEQHQGDCTQQKWTLVQAKLWLLIKYLLLLMCKYDARLLLKIQFQGQKKLIFCPLTFVNTVA